MINWDEPYRDKKLKGDDVLIGASSNGSLIYLPAAVGDPSRNVLAFTGSKNQKQMFLITNLFNTILGGRSAVLVSPEIKNEIFGFARSHDYMIKDLDIESMSNHWQLLNLLEEAPVESVHKFIRRLALSAGINESVHTNNALNYLSSVLLYVKYTKKGDLKDVKKYLNFDLFEREINKCDLRDPARIMFDFSRQANNYLKWDIPILSNLLSPIFSKSITRSLGTGSMSVNELTHNKCIYVLKPSTVCPWLIPFILSYILDSDADFDVYLDGADMTVPDFDKVLKKNRQKIFVATQNYDDISAPLLPHFGAKLAFHGCDIEAAKYLSAASGIDPGSDKLNRIYTPQEIVNCGHRKVLLFVLSAKIYPYRMVDISYLNDVLEASLKDAGKE